MRFCVRVDETGPDRRGRGSIYRIDCIEIGCNEDRRSRPYGKNGKLTRVIETHRKERTVATCCINPDPRLLESTGRMFCNNCHRYLSKATIETSEVRLLTVVPDPDEPPEYQEKEDK